VENSVENVYNFVYWKLSASLCEPEPEIRQENAGFADGRDMLKHTRNRTVFR